jgi:peptidylprolyl isomerase
VFLANDGYYTGTEFLQVVKNEDGSKFVAQAGDPTETGYGTAPFPISKETTNRPFSRGAVVFDSGHFFFSFGDYPTLNGKYTIFGQVVAGLDVLDKLALLDVKSSTASTGDEIQSITIAEE